MKISKTTFILTVMSIALISTLSTEAKICVSNVVCQQQYPWNGKVDIEFELYGEPEDTNIWIFATGYDKETKKSFAICALSGDGADGPIKPGKHKLIWNSKQDHSSLNTNELILTLSATKYPPYMVIDLSGGREAQFYPISYLAHEPIGGWTDEYKTSKMVMRFIQPGLFNMGSPERESSYEVLHQVKITQPFYIGLFEVSAEQFSLISKDTKTGMGSGSFPKHHVSYDKIRGSVKGSQWPSSNEVDEDSFLGYLRSKTNYDFDLPTEAQWEYACRAGTITTWSDGSIYVYNVQYYDHLSKYANYYGREYKPIGSYLPNSWGLYDMHGNVNEWCLDWYGDYSTNVVNPKGPLSGSSRVYRSGDCHFNSFDCRSGERGGYSPDKGGLIHNDYYMSIGFRLALTLPESYYDGNNDNYEGVEFLSKKFTYEILATSSNSFPVYKTKFYGILNDGLKYQLSDIGYLSGEGASDVVLKSGKHELMWTPKKSYTNLTNKIKFCVDYEEVTEKAKYLVLDLTTFKLRAENRGPMEDYLINYDDACRTSELWLRRINPGSFLMGSPSDEPGRSNNEGQHLVNLTKPFYIGVYETTQKQFELMGGSNSFRNSGSTRPVDKISYDMLRGNNKGKNWPKNNEVDDDSFLGLIRSKFKLNFDLPTEAQWEYACRAGTLTSLNSGKMCETGSVCSNLNLLGEYDGGEQRGYYSRPSIVGLYAPNAWGLYDMHGNIEEWCLDWYNDEYYGNQDPKGPSEGEYRVLRGGYYGYGTTSCRSASRSSAYPSSSYIKGRRRSSYPFGFRLVINP